MATRGLISLSLVSLLALGACSAIDDKRFAGVEPEAIAVGENIIEVRVLPAEDDTFDVLALETSDIVADETKFQLHNVYSDDDPERHATYVAAAKKVLTPYCREGQPFMRTYSPVPWEPFIGSFRCL